MKKERACVTDRCDTLLDKIVQIVVPYKLVRILNTQIVKNKYVYLNLWSVIHFVYGIAFFFIWIAFSKNLLLGFVVWFLIHLIWEIFEFLMSMKGIYKELFFEEYVDIIWDTIVSLLGYVVVWMSYIKW